MRCPKDIHWSNEVWEVSRDAQTPARHNVHTQLEDDAIAPPVKSRERQENLRRAKFPLDCKDERVTSFIPDLPGCSNCSGRAGGG